MYCSSCGSAVPPGLSYCNRCGAEVRAKEQSPAKRSGPSPDLLVSAIVAATILGLGAIVALMAVMKVLLQANDGLINGFAAIALLVILLVDVLFAWLLLSAKREQRKSSDLTKLRAELTRELGAAQTHSLPEPASSVTDHTTRTLEPVPRSSGN